MANTANDSKDVNTADVKKETLGFQTEVKQLLHLMVHSLYSNKEIFLRELISNASDAADKLRFEAIAKPELLDNDPELKIHIDFDSDAGTVTISDNGIGMSRDEVIANLGTIAKSGTADFLKSLTGEQQKDAHLIGQFGVGFYSSFIVSDKVTVQTRRADAKPEEGIQWESAGEGEFTLESIRKPDRGTTIILHLKKDETDFASGFRLRSLIRQYSDHISLPIIMKKEAPPAAEDEKAKDENIIDIPEEETVNTATALWTRSRKDISDEEYKEFYKHVSHDFEEPITWSHNRVEGKLEYTSLLYIPARAPFDLWQREAPRGLKLYVQRVFIMDDAEQFLPLYLRFVKGIVDCKDLSLNVSREILQKDASIEKIKSALTKRVLSMLEKMAKDDKETYAKFWNEFGQVIKEGVAEDFNNKDQLAKLLRFSSTFTDKEDQDQSLDDYLSRMQDKQEKIYYVVAENFNTAKNSPHLEIFRKKGIEVILLYNRVDEWLMTYLPEYDKKQFQDVSKGALDLGSMDSEEDKKEQEKVEKEYKDLVKKVKKVLGDKVEDVRITHRLTDSPACVAINEGDMSAQMKQMLEAAGQKLPDTKPIFELNPDHSLVKKLNNESNKDRFKELSFVLFDQAQLAEGHQLEDPAAYVQRLNKLLVDLAQ